MQADERASRDMPPVLREWVQGLIVGASAVTERGLVEVRLAQNRETSLREYFTLIRTILEEVMPPPRRTRTD